MENLIIRKMFESDLLEILEIEKRVFQDAWERQMFYQEIYEGESKVLINEYTGRIVGYICGLKIIDEYLINNFAIDIPFRRRGLGEFFLSKLISQQIKSGVFNFFLEVRKGNIPAINLYKKMGFKVLRIRKDYYKNPIEDAFEMGAFFGD